MNDVLMTYSQLRGVLLERYRRAPVTIPHSQLEDHLAEAVFGPLEILLQRINRMEQITDRLVADTVISEPDRSQMVTEFHNMLDQILEDFQTSLLKVPNESIEPDSSVGKS